jgi:flagellar biosynthetic protein FliR
VSGATLLAFARCIGFAWRAPGLSHPSVPAPVRVIVGSALALAVSSALRDARAPAGGALAAAFAIELLIGAAIGAFASLLYDGAYAGGRVVDDYSGVRAIAPNAAVVAPSAFGRIWSLAFTGGFFLFGTYRIVLLAFARSFATVPPGATIGREAILAYAIALVQTIVLVGLAVAGPAIALSFVVQIALGAISRTVPRLSGVTLASPIVFAAAIIATAVSVPALERAASQPYLNSPLQTGAVR